MKLAADLNGTADDAIDWLMSPEIVRLRVKGHQRARWTQAAKDHGMELAPFIEARVEGALHYGMDFINLKHVYERLQQIPTQ